MTNTELFTGKAWFYAKARPGYPDAALDYIKGLVPPNAVFADIGAGTGKFTELLARGGYTVHAVEPNADMREQLAVALAAYKNVNIINAPAEATTLPDNSIDVIACAQALHWFDLDAFRTECRRIGKPSVMVIAVYNDTPGGSSAKHSKLSTEMFFTNPTLHEFPNPIFYTRESWQQYMTSHSHDPLPSDPNYSAHIAEINAIFDRENVDGILRRNVVTKVYSEILSSQAPKPLSQMTGKERAKLFPIILNEYNPAWPEWYIDEKANLERHIAAENIVRISHYGSTAIPGLLAKPTVDILLEIHETADVEKLIASLPPPEYICLNPPSIPSQPPHLMFLKGYTNTGFAEKVYHIHVRYPGDWDELYFRDYLIAHPETAAEYADLKRKLHQEFEFDRDGYTEAKGTLINEITRKARENPT